MVNSWIWLPWWAKCDHGMWSLLLLAATVWSFVCVPLVLFDCNKVVLWPGCKGNARCNLHRKCAISAVCCKEEGMLLQPLSQCWMWSLAEAKSDHNLWSLMLLAATLWSFACSPLVFSDHNINNFLLGNELGYYICRSFHSSLYFYK